MNNINPDDEFDSRSICLTCLHFSIFMEFRGTEFCLKFFKTKRRFNSFYYYFEPKFWVKKCVSTKCLFLMGRIHSLFQWRENHFNSLQWNIKWYYLSYELSAVNMPNNINGEDFLVNLSNTLLLFTSYSSSN